MCWQGEFVKVTGACERQLDLQVQSTKVNNRNAAECAVRQGVLLDMRCTYLYIIRSAESPYIIRSTENGMAC